MIAVDNGQTASYYYDSLNQRVQIASSQGTTEYVWDASGRRVSTWSGSGQGLIFSVEEHEDGRIILSRETWTLVENGVALERCRERSGTPGDGKQRILYLRETPKP